MPDSVIAFVKANGSTITISLAIGFLFFVLGPIGVWFSGRKIRQERRHKAKDLLLDIVEEMIVKHENITLQKLSSLFFAIERDIQVEFSSTYYYEPLFEDVALRFQKSKHLTAEQKNEYCDIIFKLINEINAKLSQKNEPQIPRSYEKIITDLRQSIASTNTQQSNELIDELEKRLIRSTNNNESIFNLFSFYKRVYSEHPIIAFTSTALLLIGYFVVFIKYLPFK